MRNSRVIFESSTKTTYPKIHRNTARWESNAQHDMLPTRWSSEILCMNDIVGSINSWKQKWKSSRSELFYLLNRRWDRIVEMYNLLKSRIWFPTVKFKRVRGHTIGHACHIAPPFRGCISQSPCPKQRLGLLTKNKTKQNKKTFAVFSTTELGCRRITFALFCADSTLLSMPNDATRLSVESIICFLQLHSMSMVLPYTLPRRLGRNANERVLYVTV